MKNRTLWPDTGLPVFHRTLKLPILLMIFGSFAGSPNGSVIASIDPFKGSSETRSFVHKVNREGFTGGFCINPLLPYVASDFYYSDDAEDIMVLMSGCVYNKSEYFNLKNISNQSSDPEIVANLFRSEGPDFVRRLNGDFTIFILQPLKKQAYLFRDHLGVRPLAWTMNSRTLHFSSDIIGLCRAFSEGQTIDDDYLMGYFKYIDYRKTASAKVKKLLPGHWMRFSPDGAEITRYWEPEKIKLSKRLLYEDMLAELKSLVGDAVRIRCDHRFTAGAHVSSGLDSGIVSALARKEYPQQKTFYGFSWTPDVFTSKNIEYDERILVNKACEKADIRPVFSNINVSDFTHYVSDYYYNQGYFIEDKTIEQAVTVNTNLVFSGWGGDEFISTGARAIESDLLFGLKLRTFFRRHPLNKPRKLIRTVLYGILYPALGILDKGISKSFMEDARYLKKPFKRSDRKAISNFFLHSSRRNLHLGMLRFYHIQERCETWAINGWRKGVEYRYPLLDKRIIEYMLKVPSELLCKTDYYRPLMREIGEDILPEEIRRNVHKNDPVYYAFLNEMFRESAILYLDDVYEWKTNPELHFVDFELLIQDITKYKEQPDAVNEKVLFRAIVYIKAIHSFSMKYHEL